MQNPIMQRLNQSRPTMGSNLLNQIVNIKKMFAGQNPQAIFDNMVRTNPQFAQFVENCKGKSVEQLASDFGVDINTLKSLFE